MPSKSPQLDAIAAYDQIAPSFRDLTKVRRAYLDAVDSIIVRSVPKHAKSLLDVGAGDGRRALKIAGQTGIREIMLAEPSVGMRALIPQGYETWDVRIEDPPPNGKRFDAVLCLWNVLGHVPGATRVAALKNLAGLCSDEGMIFLDVLNRYNIAECGLIVVAGRRLRDAILLTEQNGDVAVKWSIEGQAIQTQGHVFTANEMDRLFEKAGLSITERIVLDYRTGDRRGRTTAGNLLYILQPHS